MPPATARAPRLSSQALSVLVVDEDPLARRSYSEHLRLNNKVTLGAEASVAAGPVGRDARAATDAQLKAEILPYSRAQGLLAGYPEASSSRIPKRTAICMGRMCRR